MFGPFLFSLIMHHLNPMRKYDRLVSIPIDSIHASAGNKTVKMYIGRHGICLLFFDRG